MSDRTDPRDHPEELLAGYADGSASPAEREEVERHLHGCGRCRRELELAAAARVALASLPEVEPPGLARAGLAGLRRSAVRPVGGADGDGARERPPAPARRTSWVPVLAAAAAVVLIAGLVAVPIALRGGEGGKATTAQGAPTPGRAAAGPEAGLTDTGANYTQASVNALAKRLAVQSKADLRSDTTSASARPPTPTPTIRLKGTPPPGAFAEFAVPTAVDCLRRGGGLPPDAAPLYLEAASFQGNPAYVGAFFLPGSHLNFMVLVVGRQDCLPLYSAKQSI